MVDDQPVVAIDRVRHVGEVVVLVAAESREIAEEALDLIEVDYQELPAVFDLVEAATPGAPVLHAQRNETNAGVHRENLISNWAATCAACFASQTATSKKDFKKPKRLLRVLTPCRRCSTVI